MNYTPKKEISQAQCGSAGTGLSLGRQNVLLAANFLREFREKRAEFNTF
jgi:hypothetical protein